MMAKGDHYSEGSVLSTKLGRAYLCLCFHSTKAVERRAAQSSINAGSVMVTSITRGPYAFRKLDVRHLPNPQQTLPVATAKASRRCEWGNGFLSGITMFTQEAECRLKTFELSPSVWKLILSICPAREVGEVRKVLGDSLVEQACDLYEEVCGETFHMYTVWISYDKVKWEMLIAHAYSAHDYHCGAIY